MKLESAIGGRMLCNIIEDMRKCDATKNYSYMDALIEELQYRANRMEDRFDRYCDRWNSGIEGLEKTRDSLKREVEKLRKEKTELSPPKAVLRSDGEMTRGWYE